MSERPIDSLVDAALAELPEWTPPVGFDARVAQQAVELLADVPPLPWFPVLLQHLQRGLLFGGGAYLAAELLRWGVPPVVLTQHPEATGWVCLLGLAPLILPHLRDALR